MKWRTIAIIACVAAAATAALAEPLPSWKDGPSKAAILEFVDAVPDADSPAFVFVEERVAVFDNDGTLWAGQPAYFQLLFALGRVRTMAPDHPDWKTTQPFKAAIEGDMKTLAESGEKGLAQIVMATHAGMTIEVRGMPLGGVECSAPGPLWRIDEKRRLRGALHELRTM